MESSQIIKYEYLELIKKLNQSNKLKNQKTDLYFYIDSTSTNCLKLFAAIAGSQKILLCEKIKTFPWAPANITDFAELEGFLSELLNNLLNTVAVENDLTKLIKLHIFKL